MPSDKDLKEGLADCDILSDEPVNKPETVRAELPEYDVEVEQNGNSVEIEITPEADKNEITNDLSLDAIKDNYEGILLDKIKTTSRFRIRSYLIVCHFHMSGMNGIIL